MSTRIKLRPHIKKYMGFFSSCPARTFIVADFRKKHSIHFRRIKTLSSYVFLSSSLTFLKMYFFVASDALNNFSINLSNVFFVAPINFSTNRLNVCFFFGFCFRLKHRKNHSGLRCGVHRLLIRHSIIFRCETDISAITLVTAR